MSITLVNHISTVPIFETKLKLISIINDDLQQYFEKKEEKNYNQEYVRQQATNPRYY